jgi:hypothetical protein
MGMNIILAIRGWVNNQKAKRMKMFGFLIEILNKI